MVPPPSALVGYLPCLLKRVAHGGRQECFHYSFAARRATTHVRRTASFSPAPIGFNSVKLLGVVVHRMHKVVVSRGFYHRIPHFNVLVHVPRALIDSLVAARDAVLGRATQLR